MRLTTRGRIAAAILTFDLALAAVLLAPGDVLAEHPLQNHSGTYVAPGTLHEDDPLWMCDRDGNQLCGAGVKIKRKAHLTCIRYPDRTVCADRLGRRWTR